MYAVPLATIFTPDDSCSTSWYIARYGGIEPGFWVITSLNEDYVSNDCNPFKQASDFWSPGVCPNQMVSVDVHISNDETSSCGASTCCNRRVLRFKCDHTYKEKRGRRRKVRRVYFSGIRASVGCVLSGREKRRG